MSDNKEKQGQDTSIKVPPQEDIVVHDFNVGAALLIVIGCGTILGVGYTYYMKVKSEFEMRRIEAISQSAAAVATKAAEIFSSASMAALQEEQSGEHKAEALIQKEIEKQQTKEKEKAQA